jgi:CBS domain-containing protein
MNVAFFLIPKNEVICLPIKCTMRQALEKMEHHRYTAVPLIDQKGKYVGTITEGDLLWKLKNTPGLSFEGTEKVLIQDVPRRVQNTPVRIDAEIEDLLSLAVVQNFVPVVDDGEVFIGIIRRSDILGYYTHFLMEKKPKLFLKTVADSEERTSQRKVISS